MAMFEVSAHMTVRPGQLEGFKKQAAECIRITREKDTHTLRYDWFLSSDGTECEVREAYTGPEGLIEHNSHILAARTKLFKDYADGHFMTVYGEPSQPLLDLLHPLHRALEPHRPPQLLGLAAGEVRGHHGDAQQLLLEERHAERALEDRLERRMRITHRLLSLPPPQVGVHHLPDDRPGPDDRDLDDEIVEALGLHARQRRHLRAALDLERADRVGAPDHLVGGGVVGRQLREVDTHALVRAHLLERVLERLGAVRHVRGDVQHLAGGDVEHLLVA